MEALPEELELTAHVMNLEYQGFTVIPEAIPLVSVHVHAVPHCACSPTSLHAQSLGHPPSATRQPHGESLPGTEIADSRVVLYRVCGSSPPPS